MSLSTRDPQNYYNLACLGEITEKSVEDPLQMQFISQRDESEQNRNNPENIRVMFDSVTHATRVKE